MNAFSDGHNPIKLKRIVRLIAWTIAYRFDVDFGKRSSLCIFILFPHTRDRIILKRLNVIKCQCIVFLFAKKSKLRISRKDTRSFNQNDRKFQRAVGDTVTFYHIRTYPQDDTVTFYHIRKFHKIECLCFFATKATSEAHKLVKS